MAPRIKKSSSPVPPKGKPKELSFFDALKAVLEGKKIYRREWGDGSTEYGFLKGDILTIHRKDEDFNWLVSEGDMSALDWVIV